MRKVVKLTEKELEKIVRRMVKEESIQELDKATYDSAAAQADERGYKALSRRLSKHGKEYGKLSKDATLDLVSREGMAHDDTQTYKILDVEVLPTGANLSVTNEKITEPFKIKVITYPSEGRIEVKRYGDRTLAKTLRDAVKFMNILKHNGVKGDFDPKLFTYGKVDFNESYISNVIKKVIKEEEEDTREIYDENGEPTVFEELYQFRNKIEKLVDFTIRDEKTNQKIQEIISEAYDKVNNIESVKSLYDLSDEIQEWATENSNDIQQDDELEEEVSALMYFLDEGIIDVSVEMRHDLAEEFNLDPYLGY